MLEITLELDTNAEDNFKHLMKHWKLKSKAALIQRMAELFTIATYVDQTNGELIARKGSHETKINLR